MGRMLKRVPLDFDYPLNNVWYGYLLKPKICLRNEENDCCDSCKKFAAIKNIPFSSWGCPDFKNILENFMSQFEPPAGEGYQLWETTSEGSPISPVFETLSELSEWCAVHATVCANIKATKKEWKQMLETEKVGNAKFE